MENTSIEEAGAENQSISPKKGGVGEFVRFTVIVVVIVIIFRMFIAQPFVVSGASMVPTFEDKNYLIIDEISYYFHTPERGDVIVFHPPVDEATYYIKRVIGLPGDTVSIKDGVVTIINTQHPDGLTLNEPYITHDAPNDSLTMIVEPDTYFVMGDNRPNSFDSRKWGLLPKKNIIGRALIRLFPMKAFDILPGDHISYE